MSPKIRVQSANPNMKARPTNMREFSAAFSYAFALILSGDGDLWAVVLLSLQVSVAAVAIAAVIAMPLDAAIAVRRFRGRFGGVATALYPLGKDRFPGGSGHADHCRADPPQH